MKKYGSREENCRDDEMVTLKKTVETRKTSHEENCRDDEN